MEEEKIYAELKQLRSVLSMVVETQDLPKTEQFLKEAKKRQLRNTAIYNQREENGFPEMKSRKLFGQLFMEPESLS